MSTDISALLVDISGGRYIRLSGVNNGRDELEDLADFSKRIRHEKDLSQRDVELKSGGGISKGYIGQIEDRTVLGHSVTPKKLAALAKGLQVSEDEVFAVARGKTLDAKESFDGEFAVLYKGFHDLSPEDQAEMRAMVRVIATEIERRRPKRPPTAKGKK